MKGTHEVKSTLLIKDGEYQFPYIENQKRPHWIVLVFEWSFSIHFRLQRYNLFHDHLFHHRYTSYIGSSVSNLKDKVSTMYSNRRKTHHHL